MTVSLIVTGLLFILSIVLLSGKGSWLIAGYNTSSKGQQEKYDKKKLSRSAGVMLLIVTIATVFLTFLHINFIIYSIIIFISAIITIIYMNKYCQKPISEDEKPNANLEKGPWQNVKWNVPVGEGLMGKKRPFESGPLFETFPKGSFVYSKLLLSDSFP